VRSWIGTFDRAWSKPEEMDELTDLLSPITSQPWHQTSHPKVSSSV
jgi:hypothetical protein